MSKKKTISIFLFIITVTLLATTFYLNSLLQNNQKDSVTQIKKTKASAQTYHRYLAINLTLPTVSVISSQSSSSEKQPTVLPISKEPTIKPTLQPTNRPSVTPTPKNTPSVLLKPSTVPTSLPVTLKPTAISSYPSSYISSSSSKGLLTYNNPISPQVTITQQNANSSIRTSPSISKKLPETGTIQYSSILFIVAVTTIFIAFLY